MQLVSTTDRAAVGKFLGDAAVHRRGDSARRRRSDPPRGRRSHRCRSSSISTATATCTSTPAADLDMAREIVVNSQVPADGRVQRGRVAAGALPTSRASSCRRSATALATHGVEIRGDEQTCELVAGAKPATEEDYATEYPGPDHFVPRRRLARRGDRPHQPLRLAAHRRDRHRRSAAAARSSPPASTARR